MQGWSTQEFEGCSTHALAVLGRDTQLRYTYTGFVCASKKGGTAYLQMQWFHHTSVDFDSFDAVISTGTREGRTIAERWFSMAIEERSQALWEHSQRCLPMRIERQQLILKNHVYRIEAVRFRV